MASALALTLALTAAVPSITSYRQPGHDRLSDGHSEQAMAAANPAAVLAWAKANCFSGLELKAGAPRTQLEIIIQVAATYDAEARRRGATDVCAQALAATASITAPAVTSDWAVHGEARFEKPSTRHLR